MGRRPTLEVQAGDEFDRLIVLEVGHQDGRRAALVCCTGAGTHGPVEKWVQLASLTSHAVKSCGCLSRETAARGARERNAAAGGTARAGTGKKGLPPGVKYIKKEKPYGSVINSEGRECAYTGAGSCGRQYKLWAEFNKGNGARGYFSWCRDCQARNHQNIPVETRRLRSLQSRCRAAGLSVEQYQVLASRFAGRCWLCGELETLVGEDGTPRRLSIDHDHSCCSFDQTPQHPLCGQCVRGLCCHRCNRQVLGNLEAVGAGKVFNYLAGSQAAVQSVLAVQQS